MNEDDEFFLSQTIEHARSLPLGDSIRFLRGMLRSINEGHPVRKRLTAILIELRESDSQLELIQIGQLKFDLQQ